MAKIAFASGVARENTAGRRSLDLVFNEQGGPSPRGSSFYKSLMACPREHGLTTAGLRPISSPDHFAVGTTFHKALEVFYKSILAFQQGLDAAGADRNDRYYFGGTGAAQEAAWASIAALATEPGYTDCYETVTRILSAYFERYWGFDRWRVLAVEETLRYTDKTFDYSARLDLLVEWNERTWAVEHKTARSVSLDSLDHYDMDMQTLGQQWLYEQCIDTSAFPPFAGVIVNVVTKAKEPKFYRREVCPSQAHLAAFEQTVVDLQKLRGIAAKMAWPKSLGHCSGAARGYGKCTYFDVCRNWPSLTVKQLVDNPPDGFTVETPNE